MVSSLYRLVYVSQRSSCCSERDIQEMIAHARNSNALKGIRGVLLASGGTFAQVLDGEHETVETLFERIMCDRRHVFPLALSFHPLPDHTAFAGPLVFARVSAPCLYVDRLASRVHFHDAAARIIDRATRIGSDEGAVLHTPYGRSSGP
jgi:hypothetical protein